ncbi:MAG: hypothetical protein MRERV_3c085 [Mycoplasmataceae bacterium RV_VA103A]|nr:MAG: hypothetical protein MRERV_3c085 [Mycoplasmataceae bacterium RV_VA103A]
MTGQNDIKAIFSKYIASDNSWGFKGEMTLDKWYELEEAAHEANKGDWYTLTGIKNGGRGFNCLIHEVEASIEKLGGKKLIERERERERESKNDWECEFCGNSSTLSEDEPWKYLDILYSFSLAHRDIDKESLKLKKKSSGKELTKKFGEKITACRDCWSACQGGFGIDIMMMNESCKYRCKKCGFTGESKGIIFNFNEQDIGKEHLDNSPSCKGKETYRPNDEPGHKTKCADCQQEKDNLVDYQANNEVIKICADCKQKRNKPGQDDNNDNDENQNAKKWGSDFGQLKPVQREGRIKTSNNWDKARTQNYVRKKVCRHCPQTFDYDKSLEFLPSKQKAEAELATHEANCPEKNNQVNQQKLKQVKWEEERKKKGSPYYNCPKCWGKVCLDKNISDWEKAKKQALADLAYHEKNECGNNSENPQIPICFSPNKGGWKHASLNYADEINENELELEQDNETEVVYQQEIDSKKPTNYAPWIIGGGIIITLGLAIALIIKRKKRKQKR